MVAFVDITDCDQVPLAKALAGAGGRAARARLMDGGGIVASDRQTSAIWRREEAIYTSAVSPATAAGTATTRLVSDVKLAAGRDPAMALIGDQQELAWVDAAGIWLKQIGKPAVLLGPGRFPTLLALPKHTLVASEHQGRVEIRRIAR